MNQPGLIYFIDDKITFKADYVHIREEENKLICSLEGEFLKDDGPFEPSMEYFMINVGVAYRNPVSILRPVYHTLRFQRELSEKLKR